MSDLAERIQGKLDEMQSVGNADLHDFNADLGRFVRANAPTILAGLAALEALDQAVAILKCASNVMLPPESNRQINNVRAQLRKLKAALQSKDAKP